MTFDEAFEMVIGHEGGHSLDPEDRGNWTGGRKGVGTLKGTKYGISAAQYPHEEIRHLTLERARELYLRDYWGTAGCDVVPTAIRFDLFDMAVNAGPRTAVQALQEAVGEKQDGVLGPRTLQAINTTPTARLIARFNGSRLRRLTDAPTWDSHGRGWARRVASNLLLA